MQPIVTNTMRSIDKKLQDKKIRPTAMRLLVYRFLNRKNVAVSLSDIEQAFDRSDRTTLYRTLKTFEDKGIVHPIDDGSGVVKYAMCEEHCKCEVGQDLHMHFYCSACRKTVCLTDHKIPKINLPEGFTANNVNLVIKGTCDTCTSIP
ncbi:Fur family ferric uptake transcriptional regulator [Aquimarina intermedia]|uniref:Fur family ferric uptake transcriptional regulator n=2 Tax=Aquimarina intermedia TaxID=350814 RepID=A0A5S5C122_9FLAO|nr:Fur family ferric uptake transcriptional regulator [Aquimarina intermedia]